MCHGRKVLHRNGNSASVTRDMTIYDLLGEWICIGEYIVHICVLIWRVVYSCKGKLGAVVSRVSASRAPFADLFPHGSV